MNVMAPTPPTRLWNRSFAVWLLASAQSQLGGTLSSLAMSFFVLEQTGSAGGVALTPAFSLLPNLLAPVAGALVDRVPLKVPLVASDVVRALRLALLEFGDPRPLSRGMQRLYTLPRLTLAALMAGGALLVGGPSLAGSVAIPAVPRPSTQALICAPSRTTPRAGLPGLRERWTAERREADCRANARTDLGDLRLADFTAALKAQGVQARLVNSRLHLRFPGQAQEEVVPLGTLLHHDGGRAYLNKYDLLDVLVRHLRLPVRLEGTLNPTLDLGGVRLRLGTPTAPLHAADLYATWAVRRLTPELAPAVPGGHPLNIAIVGATFDEADWPRLRVRDSTGHFLAMVDNTYCLVHGPGPQCGSFGLRVRASQGDQVAVAPYRDGRSVTGRVPRVVDSVAAFKQATQRREPALLLWQLDTRDLKGLRLKPIPPARVAPGR